MQKAILLTSILIGTSSIADETVTTGNLLSQDFNDWNGNIPLLNDSIHNDHVLPGIEGGYMEYTVNQIDTGLSQDIVNRGFSSTLGADIWFWSQSDQTVVMTQTYDDGMGNATSQHRSITGTCGNDCSTLHNYNTFTDTLIVAPNTATEGNVTARFDFTSLNANTNYPLSHNGADVEHPTLSLTYSMPSITVPFVEPLLIKINPIEKIKQFIEPIIKPFIKEKKIEDVYVIPNPIQARSDPEPKPIVQAKPIAKVKEKIAEVKEEKTEPTKEIVKETMEADIEKPVEVAKPKVQIKTAIINKPTIEPINIVMNINIDTQAMLQQQPDLSSYTNKQMVDVVELPKGDMNLFNQIELAGYNKAIYQSKEKMLAMLITDPIFIYEVKLERAKAVTDRAYKKLQEALSARDI